MLSRRHDDEYDGAGDDARDGDGPDTDPQVPLLEADGHRLGSSARRSVTVMGFVPAPTRLSIPELDWLERARQRGRHGEGASAPVDPARLVGRGLGAQRTVFDGVPADREHETRAARTPARRGGRAAVGLRVPHGHADPRLQRTSPDSMASDQHGQGGRADHVRGGFRRSPDPRPADRDRRVEPRTVPVRLLGHVRRGTDHEPGPVLLRSARAGQKLLREDHRGA